MLTTGSAVSTSDNDQAKPGEKDCANVKPVWPVFRQCYNKEKRQNLFICNICIYIYIYIYI